MSVENLLLALTNCDVQAKQVKLSYAEAEAIGKTLRAGQERRDKAQEFIHTAECDGDEELIQTVEAWDAALKGESNDD